MSEHRPGPFQLGFSDGALQGTGFSSGLTWENPVVLSAADANEAYDAGVNGGIIRHDLLKACKIALWTLEKLPKVDERIKGDLRSAIRRAEGREVTA